TGTESYWSKEFKLTRSDLEFIYNLFLETETPIKTPDLIQRLIDFRVESELRLLEKYREKGKLFRPADHYQIGDELVFPAFDFSIGKVIDQRPGENPEPGEFTVLKVEFEDGKIREIACDLKIEHKLNEAITEPEEIKRPDAARIYQRFKRVLTPIVVDTLREDQDTLFIAKRWFLKSLLLDVNIGHLNLAEAVLDINGGGPVETLTIARDVGFGEDVNPILRTVSLDYGLLQDERFDEVGPAGQVAWFLRRFEPPEIITPPAILRYQEINYDPSVLSEELLDFEEEIDDELSIHELVDEDELQDTATITLTYPHWRSGTLPLSQRAEHLFPIAYRTPRIRMTLLDGMTGDEINGWVVRDYGFVFGLTEFYQRHHLPIGAYIHIKPHKDLSRVEIYFESHKPRIEWLWIAHPDGERLRFEEGQQMIGAHYDDLMALGIEDIVGLDTLRERYEQRRTPLSTIMKELTLELAQFSPQRHIHSKTLYSAVNLLRRCPPAPIFATLCTDSAFVHTGGPYWRLA
ncbi:MAG TPA: hypothetical protein VJZ27_15655, partial [Aggregatilineales bacterium]|nr:hypothetical protein [Aggregatilineales bacterium]